MYAVVITKNGQWQLNFIAIHVSLISLDDQKDKKNETMNHAWLAAKLFSMKKCGMTSLGEKKHVTNHINLDSNSEPYITLPNFTKEQELKWFSNNDEDIMLEHAHNTNTRFDLRYSGKYAIKLEPHLCTCIDLKIALEILATTMIQLASRSSLAKKGINIRRRIIDAEYVENIIAMLQNDSEKAYIIEPNEKIAQTIFLPLVKIAQLVSVGNRKKLRITAKGI
ncbi:hypothetical protein G9A89_022108 [Geosiphon pyriformis]|nr:hypothetical protein G9A89_022108 [Geosiphon pyriformis]